MWAAAAIIAGAAVMIYMAGCWWREDYEGDDSEVIVKHWGGDNNDKYEVRYVPMYRNKWGKIYYGEFHRTSDGKWREQTYKNIFGDAFFTKRAIRLEYSDATETSRDTESIEMSRHLASVYDSNIREETHGNLNGKYSSHLVWVESPEV